MGPLDEIDGDFIGFAVNFDMPSLPAGACVASAWAGLGGENLAVELVRRLPAKRAGLVMGHGGGEELIRRSLARL